ncbi:hypothetical protein CONCODRAFT_125618 [Conidiobolus coronatus NRRL 28638]|uniref:Uncharacterized protein n=1 Tax=Conidiobolus coronatus (strain ATCC 28846 / CBS 209.66 / NRRL 28638) TaxID=796925 RepID=A0A137NVD3_CONC2|nr:hypothetical protein CONCODRAFT_125618 [Conidiobolus coronatus NRRL 28638]|eukprot:KXN66658.1 hypothetical protein CONCODRAFT_125618 [Conidiobolus coronatus NRRL 28638]
MFIIFYFYSLIRKIFNYIIDFIFIALLKPIFYSHFIILIGTLYIFKPSQNLKQPKTKDLTLVDFSILKICHFSNKYIW